MQNPWKEIFKSSGNFNPWPIGVEARRYAAKNGTLGPTHMQSAPAGKDLKVVGPLMTEVTPPMNTIEAETNFDETADENEDDIDSVDVPDNDFDTDSIDDDEDAGFGADDSDPDMQNFADDKMAKEVAEEIAFDKDPIYGAENWIFSKWDFKNVKAVKFSATWWVIFVMRFVKITVDGWKFFGSFDSNYGFYNYGRFLAKVVWQLVFLVNSITSWNLMPSHKPWVRYAGVIPKPDNYEELKYRPVSWTKDKPKGKKGYKK